MAASGPDGRFEVAIPPAELGDGRATRAGCVPIEPVLAARCRDGARLGEIDSKKPGGEITCDSAATTSRSRAGLSASKAKPIAGLTVSIGYIVEFPAELLKRIVKNAGKMNADLWGEGGLQNAFIPGGTASQPPCRTGPMVDFG